MCTYFENQKTIKIESKSYDIEYFLGGDLKFLALVLGVNAATADYPCPWCESEKEKFVDNIDNHVSFRVFDSKILYN